MPSVRGRAVSRPLNDILANVRRVIGHDFKEIVITGVNIGRYDYEGIRFENVIEKVLELPGDFRVRISSLEPDGFGDDFHQLFAHPKLAPHLHLCLQSGSEQMLIKMRRMYTASQFRDIMERFRKFIPDFNFTTDVIVGFPGETEKDFKMTLDFLMEATFSHIHTFRYSRRTRTRADRMKEQIPGNVMSKRSEKIRQVSEEMRKAYLQSMIGKQQRVLIEKVDDDMVASGYGEHYVPIKFKVSSKERNRFEEVYISGMAPGEELILNGVSG
ncbi:MAG TPA: MiaB/RimO family radical SAM methylthiotransferase [Bacteroidales bacterium]|nr:MiaB/RimO family radical SAM methylthiotransferase [Bacteroidales bacterium]